MNVSGWLVEFSWSFSMGKMYAVISFYLRAFEWIWFCLKWKKRQFIFATVSIVVIQQNMTDYHELPSLDRVWKGSQVDNRQSSSHSIQSLYPEANLTSDLGIWDPLKVSKSVLLLRLYDC